MEREKSEQMAIAILRQIVDALAEERFDDISKLAELRDLLPEKLRDIIIEQLWTYPNFDHWSETRTIIPSNPCYTQLNFFHFNDGSGFAVDYDLTADGTLTDLTLQMEFLYDGKGGLRPILLDIHVM